MALNVGVAPLPSWTDQIYMNGNASAPSSTSCSLDAFNSILDAIGVAEPVKVIYATPIAEGGSSFDPSPPFQSNVTELPELCAVNIEVQSSETSSYRFSMFLPPPDNWNTRIMTTGNGGFGGGINYIDMGHLSHYGFATLSTDTGHLSGVVDGSWALDAPDSVIDWGWRAMHGSVKLGKQIIRHYYETDIKYSYYAGCSTGGRQGLKEMQISPDSFDGVLAGAPAWWTTHLQSWTTWYPLQNYPVGSPAHIPAERFVDIAQSINEHCDPQDGRADNITQNPFHCTIDYTTLNLTSAQIETLKTLYSNWTDANGNFLFPSHSPGSLLNLADPTSANPLGYTFYSYFVKNDTSYNFTSFTLADLAQADATNPGSANADDFARIDHFAARGGKLMMYHGWLDPAIPAGSSLYWYNQTVAHVGASAAAGGCDVDDYLRLFMVPNMGHCSGSQPPGSDAPWYFSAASQNPGPARSGIRSGVPGIPDGDGKAWEYDAVLALMRWVEEGKAPERLVATKYKGDNTTEVVRRGVVCKWPERAVWVGAREGDAATADNWSCEK